VANTNFNPQGTAQVTGGYAQPSPGITEGVVTPADPSGNAYKTSLAASGTANLQTTAFRDSVVTAQITHTATSPAAAGTIATLTPGTAGIWEISGYITITGTTVAAADSNNMALNQTSTALLSPIMITIAGTTGTTISWPIPTVTANLTAADTVNVTAVGNATTNAVYQATIICRRVG
jgi:hypothetical protein